jgi:nucleoside-diphosphate-sugar epimerase
VKIFITGGSGFIGSHLIPKLLEKNYEVYALVRHSPRKAKIEIPSENIIIGDILDIHCLKKVIKEIQPEIVIHLAAITPVRYSFENPYIYAETNYIGTMNMVLASLLSRKLERFIYGSSIEVYGDVSSGVLINEDFPMLAGTPYAVSKVAADLFVQISGKCYNLPYTILRPTNTYGRKTEKGYFIEKVITQMLTKNEVFLDGNPETVRDFMYVEDHVSAYLRAIEYQTEYDRIFNIAPSEPRKLREVVDIIKNLIGWEGEIHWNVNPRPSDPHFLVANNMKARSILGWSPKYSLEEGLKLTIDYWKKKLGK